jgi:hypothetical protein
MQLRSGLFDSETRGNIFSLALSAWSVRPATARTILSNFPAIEKPYQFHLKLLLYSWSDSVYGPTLTRLATKLRQTKGGLQ